MQPPEWRGGAERGRSAPGARGMDALPDDHLVRSLYLSEEPVRADLAVVLGSFDPSEATRRADRAAELYRGGYVPRVLFSGGDPAGRGRSEAAAMAETAA